MLSGLNRLNYRKVLWRWARKQIGRKDLTVTEKLVLWALVERFRIETWSSHDAVTYYSAMTGMNRNSTGKALNGLISKKVIQSVKDGEGEEGKFYPNLVRGGKRHFLLVGLAYDIKRAQTDHAADNRYRLRAVKNQ